MFSSVAAIAARPRSRRPILLGGAIAAAAALALGAMAGAPSDTATRLEHARDLVLARRPEAAMAEVRRAIAELGESGDADLRLRALSRAAQIADLHLGAQRVAEAIGFYQRIAQDFPRTPEAFDAGVRIAEILRERLGDDVRAEEQFAAVADAFASQPGAERLFLRAARIAIDGRRYPAARDYARRVIDGHPDSELVAQALEVVAVASHLEGRHADAVAAYERIAAGWPGTTSAARALFEAGNCLAEQGDFGHAIGRYIESLPEHPDPLVVQRGLERARRRFVAERAMSPGSREAAFGPGFADARQR